MEYDEDTIPTKYICNHYQHLMTDFERKTVHTIFRRMKADASTSPETARIMLEERGLIDDAEVNEALANGHEAYRRQVRNRILKERTRDVFINRCPHCQDARGKLCLWCGCSWFDEEVYASIREQND